MRHALLALILVAGCPRSASAPPPPAAVGAPLAAGSASGPISFELALYPSADGQENPLVVLERTAANFPRLHHSEKQASELPAWQAATVDVANYGPSLDAPSPALVAHLSPVDRARLPRVKQVTFVTFRGAPGDTALLEEAQTLVRDASRSLNALILDSETGELFSTARFSEERLHKGLADQVVVRINGSRITTAGLGKLGLPDLVIDDARVASAPDLAHALLDLAAQQLTARGPGAPAGLLDLGPLSPELRKLIGEHAQLIARAAQRRETDAQNRLVELVLPKEP